MKIIHMILIFLFYSDFIKKFVKQILSIGIKKGVTLNVNLPDCSFKNLKGVKYCNQGDRFLKEKYDKKKIIIFGYAVISLVKTQISK